MTFNSSFLHPSLPRVALRTSAILVSLHLVVLQKNVVPFFNVWMTVIPLTLLWRDEHLHCWRCMSKLLDVPGRGKGEHTFCVRIMAGVIEEMGVRGSGLMIAVTSAMRVESTSRARHDGLMCESMESRICHAHHSFPHSSHVRIMRWVKDPCTSILAEVALHAGVVGVLH